MKKKNQEVSKGKLKLNKERIVKLTAAVVLGGNNDRLTHASNIGACQTKGTQ